MGLFDKLSGKSKSRAKPRKSSEVLEAVRAAHEQLESWIAIICRVLIDEGVSEEQSSLRMAALLETMQRVSEEFPPAVVSLTLTALLNFQLEHILRTKKDQVASQIRDAVTGLGEVLATLLKESGRKEDEVTQQVKMLSKQLIAVSGDSGVLIFALAVAVALHNHTTYLLKEAMLPPSL